MVLKIIFKKPIYIRNSIKILGELMGTGKIILGLILVIIGLWAILPLSWNGLGLYVELWEVIKGIVPIFLIFIGAILVWIELEELKIEKPPRKKR
jgi:hypothetical protein